jgi:hypothetical protein
MARALRLLALAFFACSGCSKDEEVNAALDVVELTTDRLVQTVRTADDPTAGVAAAREYLEQHRDALERASDTLSDVRQFQIEAATKARLEVVVVEALTEVPTLRAELMAERMTDAELHEALGQLVEDYHAALNLGS